MTPRKFVLPEPEPFFYEQDAERWLAAFRNACIGMRSASSSRVRISHTRVACSLFLSLLDCAGEELLLCGVTTRKPALREREQCIFCKQYVEEWHHVAGRKHCRWFEVPLCAFHHARVTKIYNDNVEMTRAPNHAEQIRRAREACVLFLWLLDHVDNEELLSMALPSTGNANIQESEA